MAWPHSTNCHAILPDIFEKLLVFVLIPEARVPECGGPAPPLGENWGRTVEDFLDDLAPQVEAVEEGEGAELVVIGTGSQVYARYLIRPRHLFGALSP